MSHSIPILGRLFVLQLAILTLPNTVSNIKDYADDLLWLESLIDGWR